MNTVHEPLGLSTNVWSWVAVPSRGGVSILLLVKNASLGQVFAHGAFNEGARVMDVSFACQSCMIGASVWHWAPVLLLSKSE
jgi:hypothetical protein